MANLQALESSLFHILQDAIDSGYDVIVKDGIIRIQDPSIVEGTRHEINFTVPKIEPIDDNS